MSEDLKENSTLETTISKEDVRLFEQLKGLSKTEKQILLKQINKGDMSSIRRHRHHYPKNHAKFGYISDLHVGHKEFKEALFAKAAHTFKKEGIDTVYCAGDLMEGMSGRPGHVYELAHIGFTAQADYLEQLFNAFPHLQFHGIDGNHDEWYLNKADIGVVVGEEIERRCENYHHLGQMEARVIISPKVNLLLYHGRDGTAYAVSYKMQKLMESFTGGDKPNMILSGHYHKHLTMWNRNIFGIEAGTLCGQTPFMRGKKIPAHLGFGIVDVWYDNKGVKRLNHTFFPEFD